MPMTSPAAQPRARAPHESETVRPSLRAGPAARRVEPADGRPRFTSPGRNGDLDPVSCTLAHELRQPLSTISLGSENLRLMLEGDRLDPERMRQSVCRIAEQVERAQSIIEHTLSSYSGRTDPAETADMIGAAQRAAGLLEALPAAREVQFVWQLPEGRLLVGVSRIELEQVFVNLLRNAVESIGDRRAQQGWDGQGRVTVTIQQCGGSVRCIVADNGAGLAPASAELLFQPFFTTKASGGTGLGLYICGQIVDKAAGTIRLQPGSLDGAQVEIRMPLVCYDGA